ncbi:hypothetical protein ACYSUO_32620 [Streptomyces sp. UC4497]
MTMNRPTVHKSAVDCAEALGELVTDSYRLVVARLPRVERPVGPHTYGITAYGIPARAAS